MKTLIVIGQIFGVCILLPCLAFAITLSLYMFKQVRWESELKHYKKNPDRTVTNRQGHIIHTPCELLDELAGYEERIAK